MGVPASSERVVRLIELMVRNDPEDWSLHGSVDEVREALRAVLAHRRRGRPAASSRSGRRARRPRFAGVQRARVAADGELMLATTAATQTCVA